jgi:hypothetical protein
MRRSVIAVAALVAFTTPFAAGAAETAPGSDPMEGWRPPKVKNEKKDRAEIAKLFKAMEAAGKKGDIETAASFIDFPVLMLTDDSKGEAHGAAWTRAQWVEVMAPFYKPMPDMKVTEKPSVFLISDSLATVTNVATITMGKKKPITTRNSMLLARVGGEWKVKAMVEGGWGDSMAGAPEGVSGTGQTSPDQTAPSTTPGETSPTMPGQTSPTTPSETSPSTPGQTSPTTPGETSPTTPGQTSPTTPGETAPSTPGQTTPPAGERTTR